MIATAQPTVIAYSMRIDIHRLHRFDLPFVLPIGGRHARAQVGRHGHELLVHDLPRPLQVVEVRLKRVGDVVPPPGQFQRVNALALQQLANSVAQGDGDG